VEENFREAGLAEILHPAKKRKLITQSMSEKK